MKLASDALDKLQEVLTQEDPAVLQLKDLLHSAKAAAQPALEPVLPALPHGPALAVLEGLVASAVLAGTGTVRRSNLRKIKGPFFQPILSQICGKVLPFFSD